MFRNGEAAACKRPKAVVCCAPWCAEIVYPGWLRERMEAMVDLQPQHLTAADFAGDVDLSGVEIIFGSWGLVPLSAEVLAKLPELKIVLYGAGSIRNVVTDAFWRRGLTICSAWAMNAVPVAEYTFAQIILCLKKVYPSQRATRLKLAWARETFGGRFGAYDATVGLVSLGQIARLLLERLRTLDVRVAVYDPFLSEEQARELGVRKCGLEELFDTCEVVSLHTPWLPETEGLITGDLLRRLPVGGSFINTARGAVVREQEMIQVLIDRPDIQAILDVTYPEPPAKDSPLFTLPNVFLTPHIAGSMDRECARMGAAMVDECARFLAAEPLQFSVSREQSLRMA